MKQGIEVHVLENEARSFPLNYKNWQSRIKELSQYFPQLNTSSIEPHD